MYVLYAWYGLQVTAFLLALQAAIPVQVITFTPIIYGLRLCF